MTDDESEPLLRDNGRQ
ncbi:unnamed protein product, partial [Rotaria magnacalcarata]